MSHRHQVEAAKAEYRNTHPLCRDDEDPAEFAALVAKARSQLAAEVIDEDLSRISRALTSGRLFDLRDDYDRRAHETLKTLIAAARERSEHSSPLAPVAADPGGPPPPNPSARGEL